MLEQVVALEAELLDVESRLADPAIIGDPGQLEAVGRRYKELEAALAVGRPLRAAADDLGAARELLKAANGDERDQLQIEISSLEEEIERLEAEEMEWILKLKATQTQQRAAYEELERVLAE